MRLYTVLMVLAIITLGFGVNAVLADDAAAPAVPTATAVPAPPAEPAAPAAPAPPESPAAAAPAAVAPAAPVVTPVPVAQPVAPTITADTELFRRTPVIDGVVEDGEWDTYYTLNSSGVETTAYADWDSSYLYVAAKSTKPIDVLVLLDGRSDGWFNGEDNYEFRAMRAANGPVSLSVSRYESKNSKSSVANPVTPTEAAMVEAKSSRSDSAYALEMRIPAALVRGFEIAEGRKIGFQIATKTAEDESAWVPGNVTGSTRECRECSFVTRKIAALKPLSLGFDLRDTRIARGDELVGKFHISDDGADTVDVRSFTIAGEGKSGDYLSSQKIRLEGVAPKKHISHDVRSIIPSNMPLGSWAIGAEVRSADSRLGGALVSFDVVEPFEIELRLPTKDVRADVKDVTFGIAIRNNMRHSLRGKAKIALPIGWELWKNADLREFSIDGGSVSSVAFKAKPPLGALGRIPVKIEVSVGGDTKTAEGGFGVVNP